MLTLTHWNAFNRIGLGVSEYANLNMAPQRNV